LQAVTVSKRANESLHRGTDPRFTLPAERNYAVVYHGRVTEINNFLDILAQQLV
jgi:hypothetical protein